MKLVKSENGERGRGIQKLFMFHKTICIPAKAGMTLKMVCGNFHADYGMAFARASRRELALLQAVHVFCGVLLVLISNCVNMHLDNLEKTYNVKIKSAKP